MFQEHIEEESVILACVRSFHKVFLRYIEAGEMFQETQLSEEMTGLVITYNFNGFRYAYKLKN